MSHSGPEGEPGPVGVSQELMDNLKWLKSEMSSGKRIPATCCPSEKDRTWNDATDRCLRLVDKYSRGEGLFQK
jgi:hypothetical protein